MSFLHWFSGRTRQTPSAASPEAAQIIQGGRRPALVLPQPMGSDAGHPEDGRKVKRHARREQMYVAIREAMTRAGVLSASYRFKVLSLDPGGDEFLAMMDLQWVAGDAAPQLGAIELLIMQSARLRFDITVSAVYWRVHEVASISKPARPAETPSVRPMAARFEPVQAEEVAAFQQALLAASARHPGAAAEKSVKKSGGWRPSAPRLDDFEDTEVTEAGSSPVLSTTQYGELN
ncbi:MAG: hypothetical protein ABIV07_09330 [Polaromonas sp.]